MARGGPTVPHGGPGGGPGSAPSAPRPHVDELSAGGLVLATAADGVVRGVLIGRLDRAGVLRWLLPKGHVEAGEGLAETAVREVAEETGIRGHVLAPLGVVDFWFTTPEHLVHKTVHHFLLAADGGELSTDDHEVDEVAWVALDELAGTLSYGDERRLMARLPDLLTAVRPDLLPGATGRG